MTCDVACLIRDFFDVTLQTQLLYANEREPFEKYKDKLLDYYAEREPIRFHEIRYSNHFGFVHLLRCLVKLKDFMSYIGNTENYPEIKAAIFEV